LNLAARGNSNDKGEIPMTSSEKKRTKVFVSYSHEDAPWLNRLKVHMKPLIRDGLVDFWDDTKIRPGMDWKSSIREAISSASVAILLISADFLASEFIASNELPPLLEAAEKEGALILPIILSPSLFTITPSLSRFQSVNPPDRPLIGMTKVEQEEVFFKAAKSTLDAEEKRLRAEEEQRRKIAAEEAKRKAVEAEKRKTEEEAKRKAEEDERQRAEELKRRAEEEQKRVEEAAKAKQQMPMGKKVLFRSYVPWLIGGAMIIIIAGMYLYSQPKISAPIVEKKLGTEDSPIKREFPKGKTWKDPFTGMEFVMVPGGCYEMGDTFGDGQADEKPVHKVCVDDFYLGKYETTVSQFKLFVSETGYTTDAEKGEGCYIWTGKEYVQKKGTNWKDPGSFAQNDNEPVVCISWRDAQEFARWLSKKSGKEFRLPTEAEWEYAARSGGKREKWAGTNSESILGDYAWFSDNAEGRTHPVGQKKPNGLGLYDTSGNVWEWVNDWYDDKYYGKSPEKNPQGPSGGMLRVLRGGAWYFNQDSARCANRFRDYPDDGGNLNGFRCAGTP
jgi:formylglycine-generating enzyme required for sulfatase activity